MKGRPLYLMDLDRMRSGLRIPATDRIRLFMELCEGKLSIYMECIVCEELVEWLGPKGMWICPSCQNETTEVEARDLLATFMDAMGQAIGNEDGGTAEVAESDPAPVDGERRGRWRDLVRKLMGT